MGKKIYTAPLMEVEQISLSKCLLDVSPAGDSHPIPPLGPGYTPIKRRTPVF